MERELKRLGLEPEVDRFRAVADTNWFPISASLILLLGLALFHFTRWPGVGVTAVSPVLMWWALSWADSPLRSLLPRVESRSVVVRLPPKGETKLRVAVVAHLDANRCRLAWQAGGARAIRIGSLFTLLVGLAVPVLLTASVLVHAPALGLAAFAGGGYALFNLAVLAWELRRPGSPGANDNAASVAVALGLAERLAKSPLKTTEVWFLFTGAEESDHRGIKEALRRRKELAGARFVVLEGVGAGELSYLTREGVLFPYRPDPEMAALVAWTGRRLGITGKRMTVVCETQTLRRLGLPAVTIAGYDPETGALPNWHTPQDLPESLSRGSLLRALGFLEALLRDLDAGLTG